MKISTFICFFMVIIAYQVNCYVGETKSEKPPEEKKTVCPAWPSTKNKIPSDDYCKRTRNFKYLTEGAESFGPCVAEGPRCMKSNSNCLPIPYDVDIYDSSKKRLPVKADRPEPSFPHCPNRGSCSQDGDCYKSGCGAHCISFNTAKANGNCTKSDLSGTYCGCVNQRCTWFKLIQ